MMLKLYIHPESGSAFLTDTRPAGGLDAALCEEVCDIPAKYAPRNQGEWEQLGRELGVNYPENYEFKPHQTTLSMKEKVFIVIGPVHNGKTTVAKGLNYATKLKRSSCSDRIMAYLVGEICTQSGREIHAVWDEVKKTDKDEIRAKLVALGDYLVNGDPARLCRELIESGVRIIDGVRRKEELKEAREYCKSKGFECEVWWVKRIPTPPLVADNTEVVEADGDMTIENDTTTEKELWEWITAFLAPVTT